MSCHDIPCPKNHQALTLRIILSQPFNGICIMSLRQPHLLHHGEAQVMNGEAQAMNGEAQAMNGEAQAMDGEAKAINGEAQAMNGEAEAMNIGVFSL